MYFNMNLIGLAWAGFLSTASADFAFTMPVDGIVFKAGQPLTITWSATGDENKNINLSIVEGDPNDLQRVIEVGDTTLASKAITVTIPDTLPNGKDYAVKGEATGDINYSHQFQIEEGPNVKPRVALVKPESHNNDDDKDNNENANDDDKKNDDKAPEKIHDPTPSSSSSSRHQPQPSSHQDADEDSSSSPSQSRSNSNNSSSKGSGDESSNASLLVPGGLLVLTSLVSLI